MPKGEGEDLTSKPTMNLSFRDDTQGDLFDSERWLNLLRVRPVFYTFARSEKRRSCIYAGERVAECHRGRKCSATFSRND